MGGSGSGGYTPSAPSSACAKLSFQAALNSPKATVLAQLQVGTTLQVELDALGQSVEVFFNSQLAGSITGSQVARLINCLMTGFTFRAVVVTLSGGQCLLRIEAA